MDDAGGAEGRARRPSRDRPYDPQIVEALCRRYADVGRAVWGRERATRRSARRRRGPDVVRAVGYARVYGPKDARAHPLDEQRREIARYCAARRYDLVRIDADEGGPHEARAAILRQAADGAYDFEFDLVVVAGLDRWALPAGVERNLERLGRADAGFASVAEGIDFTLPTGRLMLSLLDVPEFLPIVSRPFERTQWVRVARGVLPGPTAPFGYRKRPDGHLDVVPEEKEAVIEAFRRRARGDSYVAIARWLNGMGLRTRGRRGSFTQSTTSKLLANVAYRGGIRYRGRVFPGAHEALVDDDLFLQVQARRGEPRPQRPPAADQGVLQGRLHCRRCGSPLQYDRAKARPRYEERPDGCSGSRRSLPADLVDEQVGPIWGTLPFPRSWRRRMAEIVATDHDDLVREALFRHARRITGGRYPGAAERPYADHLARLGELSVELVPSAPGPSAAQAAELFSDMAALWQRAADPERRRLIAPLIRRVYVDIDEKRLTSVEPTPAFAESGDPDLEWWWDR